MFLTGSFSALRQGAKDYTPSKIVILRDPVHALVTFEEPEEKIVFSLLEAREVQRLRRIRQLGLASLAYPGADHTRFSHAVGAAFVLHAISFIPVTILGVLFMAAEGLTLAGARRLAHEAEGGPDADPPGGRPGSPAQDVRRTAARADPGVREPIKRGVR